MGFHMLIKWINILCLRTAFLTRSVIFGARFLLGFATSAEFKMAKPYVYSSDSTLFLYTCLFMIWILTYCHIPCLLRHTAYAEAKISKAIWLAIMRISNFSKTIRELTPSLYDIIPKTQDSTLFLSACFDMLWFIIRISSLIILHILKRTARDLIFLVAATVIIIFCRGGHIPRLPDRMCPV